VGRVKDKELADHNEHQASKPNYFISIPINDSNLKTATETFKAELVANKPEIERFLQPDGTIHLTVCTLKIKDDNELETVRNIMDKIVNDLRENISNIILNFKSIGEFYNKVLFIKCTSDQMNHLVELKKTILDEIKENGISCAGNYYNFEPHLTILKIKSQHGTFSNPKHNNLDSLVDKSIWNKYEVFNFGEQSINKIELCQMAKGNWIKNDDDSQSYPVEHSIDLNSISK
jgi:2'-5' RNA ligase